MVSSAIEQRSELKQNLIGILNQLYPETHSALLDSFAGDLANLASENQLSNGSRKRSLWSANDVLLIAYPDNIISQNIPPLRSLQKFLANYFSDTISILHVLPFFPSSLCMPKSERCGTAANFALLRDPLFWGTARAPYLLVLCKMIQLKVS